MVSIIKAATTLCEHKLFKASKLIRYFNKKLKILLLEKYLINPLSYPTVLTNY